MIYSISIPEFPIFMPKMSDLYLGSVEFRPKKTKLKGWQKQAKRSKRK